MFSFARFRSRSPPSFAQIRIINSNPTLWKCAKAHPKRSKPSAENRTDDPSAIGRIMFDAATLFTPDEPTDANCFNNSTTSTTTKRILQLCWAPINFDIFQRREKARSSVIDGRSCLYTDTLYCNGSVR